MIENSKSKSEAFFVRFERKKSREISASRISLQQLGENGFTLEMLDRKEGDKRLEQSECDRIDLRGTMSMTPDELMLLITRGETLTVEFKSDRGPLPDSDLVESVVCLANHSGGQLFIGVEDNGQISGLHASHRPMPNPGLPRSSSGALAAFIAARTVPPLAVEVDFVDVKEKMVAVLAIAPAKQPVATSDGRVLIRYLDVHAQPGCRPLYPYELSSWRADHGQNDLSALLAPDASWEDLDIVEFARLKRMVAEYNGDQVLLELSNERIAAALGVVSVQ